MHLCMKYAYESMFPKNKQRFAIKCSFLFAGPVPHSVKWGKYKKRNACVCAWKYTQKLPYTHESLTGYGEGVNGAEKSCHMVFIWDGKVHTPQISAAQTHHCPPPRQGACITVLDICQQHLHTVIRLGGHAKQQSLNAPPHLFFFWNCLPPAQQIPCMSKVGGGWIWRGTLRLRGIHQDIPCSPAALGLFEPNLWAPSSFLYLTGFLAV